MNASTLPQTAGAHEASTRLPSLGRRGEGWVALQGLVIALVVLTGILSPRWPPGVRLWLAIAALVPLGVGLRLAIGGLRGLGSQMTALPMPVAGGRLRQGGAYALVRHPMYGGVLLFMLAWVVLLVTADARTVAARSLLL